jgi:hypothetical protein
MTRVSPLEPDSDHHAEPLPGRVLQRKRRQRPRIQEVATFSVDVSGAAGGVAVSSAHGTVTGAAGGVLLRPFARLIASTGDSVTTYGEPWEHEVMRVDAVPGFCSLEPIRPACRPSLAHCGQRRATSVTWINGVGGRRSRGSIVLPLGPLSSTFRTPKCPYSNPVERGRLDLAGLHCRWACEVTARGLG